jgi:hypothetical protein
MDRDAHVATIKDLLKGVNALRYQPTQHGSVTLLAAAIEHLLVIVMAEFNAPEPEGADVG